MPFCAGTLVRERSCRIRSSDQTPRMNRHTRWSTTKPAPESQTLSIRCKLHHRDSGSVDPVLAERRNRTTDMPDVSCPEADHSGIGGFRSTQPAFVERNRTSAVSSIHVFIRLGPAFEIEDLYV